MDRNHDSIECHLAGFVRPPLRKIVDPIVEGLGHAVCSALAINMLLDANLHGRSVNEIIAALTGRGVPFIFINRLWP
jgi:hypothetical protein